MPTIETSSGLQTIITSCFHYQFHWMGDHWKQEIVSVGGCQAIPKIWSIEGLISHDAGLRPASPAYQRLIIEQDPADVIVAHLDGQSGSHHYAASFRFEEQPEGVVVAVEVEDRCADADQPLTATYLIESSAGHLIQGEAATITWPHPEARLVFEAEPPAVVEANEAGMGTIRLRALAGPDLGADVHTLRYRWSWITVPANQIWNRDI